MMHWLIFQVFLSDFIVLGFVLSFLVLFWAEVKFHVDTESFCEVQMINEIESKSRRGVVLTTFSI